jgi:Dolichyl-phosphate-mannose-protein mannosyltransferase
MHDMDGVAMLAAGRRAFTLLLLAVGAVSFLLRLWMLHRDGGLSSAIEYDDGVHFGSSYLLLNGTIPYRDVVFLQPPGITILMLPFAVLGKLVGLPTGFALARLATCAAAACTTVLLGRLVARHTDPARGLLAATLYAGAMPGLVAASTLLLEPWLSLFVVFSLFLAVDEEAGPRQFVLAGAAAGLGATVKVWGLVFVLTMVGWLIVSRRLRDALRYGLASAAVLVVVYLPFFVLAPGALVRDVVTTQASRPPSGIQGRWNRWTDALSVAHLTGHTAVDLATLIVTALIIVCTLRSAMVSALGRLGVALLAGAVALYAVAKPYYTHYGEYAVPFLAVVIATALPRCPWPRHDTEAPLAPRRRRMVTASFVVAAAGVLTFSVLQTDNALWRARPAAVDTHKLHQLIGNASCVVSDQMTLLILADAPLRCAWLDPRGQALAGLNGRTPPHFYPKGFRSLTGWQREWLRRLAQAQIVVVTGSPCAVDEWSPQVCHYIVQNFHQVGVVGRASPQLLPVGVWRRAAT